MEIETLNDAGAVPDANTAAEAPLNFDAALEAVMREHPEGSGGEETPPAADVDTKPDAVKPADVKPGEEKPAKPGSYKALKDQLGKEREEALAALRTEYEAKVAELTTKAATFETEAKTHAERLTAAEALKKAHEDKLTELEQRIVGEYEMPYSLEVDPEAVPVFFVVNEARTALDAAVAQAATSLGEDQRAVQTIFAHKQLFAEVMVAMTQGLAPDAVHADKLMTALQAVGVTVPREEARAAIRDLKAVLPHLHRMGGAQQKLNAIKAKNEPVWQQTQAARHEAYRQHILSAADVAENAAEGDDATLAAILKAKPELRDKLKAEADRLSGMVIGPIPGKATAATVRAAPRVLHETALKAARLPVALEAYRAATAENATLAARVAELEARIGSENATVPKPGGAPPPAGGKVDFNAALAKIFS